MPIDPKLLLSLGKIGLDWVTRHGRSAKRKAVEQAHADVAGEFIRAAAQTDLEAVRRGDMQVTDDGRPLRLEHSIRQLMQAQIEKSGAEVVANAFAMTVTDNARRIENVSAAVDAAQEELASAGAPHPGPPGPDGPMPEERTPNTDWMYRWRDYAGEVSEVDLQNLWGRILAGEVKSPGKYSLRTLEFLRNLSQREAELLRRLAPFAYDRWIWRPDNERVGDLNLDDLLEMEAMGICVGVQGLGLNRTANLPGKSILMIVGSLGFIVEPPVPGGSVSFPVLNLTQLGREVLALDRTPKNVANLRAFLELIKNGGMNLFVGRALEGTNGVSISNMQPFSAATFMWGEG